MIDHLLGLAIYGIPGWLIVGVVVLTMLLVVAGLAYVVLTEKVD